MPDKPVVFLAFANDREGRAGYLRNLPAEARRLAGALEGARQGGLCEVVVRANVTLEELFGVFQSAEYRDRVAVLHYGGHAEGYGLLLEGEGGVEAAHGAGLAELLGTQRGLRLVFLNGCATEPQAQALLAAGVSAVLVTSQAIDDGVALEFAGYFYAGLGGGASLRTAYAEAKAAVTARRGAGVVRGVGLYRPEVQALAERWPWALLPKPGAERALDWGLAEAAGDPLFGIPEVVRGDLPESPYRHLQPFGRAHAELFFGRGEAIRTLYERVTGADSPPLILLYGRSGVGKSSLLEAGLLARLEPSYTLCYRRREPARGLWGSVLGCLGEGLDGAGARARWRQREAEAGKPLLIVLDQVEEIYTRPNPSWPEEVAECLDALQQLLADPNARPQGKLILGFRQEWLPELEQALAERELPRSAVYLQPLDRRGLFEAIIGPSRSPRLRQRYGLRIEDGLAETIADMLLADPEAPLAPTLQILLAKLWAAARGKDPARPHFDSPLFRALKREGLLLGDYLDQQLAAIADQHAEAVRSGLVLDLLAYHTTARGTAEGRPKEVLRAAYAHCPDLAALLASCQGGYLLLPGPEGGTRLGHDTLAPLVRERFEESDRAGQRARRVLESRALEWGEERQGALLDEADLAIVEAGQAGMRAWTVPERRLVEASRRAREKRTRQRKVYRALGLTAILAVALSAALATWQWRQASLARAVAEARQEVADRQRNLAQSRQLAAQADLALASPPTDLVLGALLAIEALKREQTVESYRAWSKAMDLLPRDVRRFGLNEHERVNAIAFSPDGQRFAATVVEGGTPKVDGGMAQVWDAATGAELLRARHDGAVTDLAFGPNGKLVATASWDRSVSVRDSETGVERYRLRHDQPILSLAFSADGTRLAAGGRNGGVWVYAVKNGELLYRRRHQDDVERVIFSAKGGLLASRSRDGTARLWHADTGEELHLFDQGTDVDRLTFSPDGQWLVTASRQGTGVKVWDLSTEKQRFQLEHEAATSDIAFSPDGTQFATASHGLVRLWAVATGLEVARFVRDSYVRDVRFSPDGRHLITMESSDGTAVLWAIENPSAPVREFRQNGWVVTMALTPDGSRLATGGDDKALKLWDVETGAELSRIRHKDKISRITFSTDGKRIATAIRISPNRNSGYSWGGARVWDADSGEERLRFGEGPRWLGAIAYSPDGGLIATGGAGGTVTLWDAATGAERARLEHPNRVDALAFLDEGRRLLTTSTKKGGITRGHLWDLEKGELVTSLPLGDPGGVGLMAVSDDRTRAVTSGRDGTLRVWATGTGEELQRVEPEAEKTRFCLGGSGRRLAWKKDDGRTVQVVDLESDSVVAHLEHDHEVQWCELSPNGSRLATVVLKSKDVWLWDVQAGALLARLDPSEARMIHALLSFSPDGALLATVPFPSSDGTVFVWDAMSGSLVSQLHHECPRGPPVHLRGFSPDGRELYTSAACLSGKTGATIARVWDPWTGEEIRRLQFTKVQGPAFFSPDGSRVAIRNRDRQAVQVWDLAGPNLAVELADEDLDEGRVFDRMVFSPDGARLATASILDRTVKVWDLASGRLISDLRHENEVLGLFFVPDGHSLLSIDDAGVVRIWDIDTGQERFRLAHNPSIERSVLSRESPRIATSNGALAQVWDVETGTKVGDFPHDGRVSELALSSDGRRLLTVAADEESGYRPEAFVRVWDVQNAEELFRLEHEDEVNIAAFGVSDTRIVTGSDDRTVRIWDAVTGQELVRLSSEGPTKDVIALSSDGRYLAAGVGRPGRSTALVDVWDISSRQRLARLPHYGGHVYELEFAPNGERLATAAGNSAPTLWDPRSARAEQSVIAHQYTSDDELALSPDGRLVYVSDGGKAVKVYELETGRAHFEISTELYDFALSADGRWLASRGGTPAVAVWDARSGELVSRLEHESRVSSPMALSHDGRFLATVTSRGRFKETLRLWDLATKQVRELANDMVVNRLAFSPDGRYLATTEGGIDADMDGERRTRRLMGLTVARLWDVRTGREVQRLQHEKPVGHVLFSPDGTLVATDMQMGGGSAIQVWHTGTGELAARFAAPPEGGNIGLGSFSPDGRHLALRTTGQVSVWEVASQREAARLAVEGWNVAFSADGRYLAIEDDDDVFVWHWPTDKVVARFHAGENVSEVMFTPDGSRLVTVGINDDMVRVWAWQVEDFIADACSRLERNLSQREWQTYIGDEDYRATCPGLPVPAK